MQNEKHPTADELQKSESKDKYLPVDPSHTSNIGEQVETGIVDVREGLNQQSSSWEHEEDVANKSEVHISADVKEVEEDIKENVEEEKSENDKDDPGFLWQNESPQANIPGQNKI